MPDGGPVAGNGNGHPRVLVVEDDSRIREVLRRVLERAGYDCEEAVDVPQAETRLAGGDFDVMLCDVRMPGESGLDLLTRVSREHPDTVSIMVSAYDDPGLVDKALRVGAYDYLVKPFKHSDVLIGVSNALHRKELEDENRLHRDHLEQLVSERTAALERVLEQLERSADRMARSREETIRRLSRAVEYRDEETGSHVERMSRYCELLADSVEFNGVSMRLASPMHDVGKIAVHDAILRKPGKLTQGEREEMQRHCEVGYEILGDSGSRLLDLAASIALTHHEKYDGSGYPQGLAADDIPIEGRIAAIADVFDALTTDRVYRPAFTFEQALEIMEDGRGTHFDPMLLGAFLADIERIVEISDQYTD